MGERLFTPDFKNVIMMTKVESDRLKSETVFPEHILLGIIADAHNHAYDLLKHYHVDFEGLKVILEDSISNKLIQKEYQISTDNMLSLEAEDTVRQSFSEAQCHNCEYASTEHLLLAILANEDSQTQKILTRMGINYKNIEDIIKSNNLQPRMGADFPDEDDEDEMGGDFSKEDSGRQGQQSDNRRSTTTRKSNNGEGTPILDKYGKDMTKSAEEGKLDPVIGREKEIERLAQILSRRKKNNPVLIGEPGVGKSAIVEGLAIRIIQRKVSRTLFGKRVVALDMASLVAGTKFRGQFEERIKSVIDELSSNKDIILFIDEIHTLVGAGNAQGSMDAANLLKPALARGEIQCIGATTLDEYRKSIEKDGALERRFQKVMVEPTTAEETMEILNNIKDKYEDHHGVTYTPEAIESCVKLTDRYISDRNFPDKAIDALDEAGSRVHISNIIVPKEIDEIEKQIEEAQKNKIKAAQAQNFESAANYRDQQETLTQELNIAKEKWEEELANRREIVDADKVAEVVAMMTGVPVQRIAQAEGIRLLNMGSELKNQIIGQDDAIDKIAKCIRRNRVGLKDPNRPIGSFMFLGPTGVGKTHLAKKLAEFLFNSADTLIRIDMSEYMEKFTVSRLVGSPPGYVGYEEGGQLTEKVRRHPYSVVLLDEIEKAHSDVFNMLLQVLDEGHLTDSLGRKVDFKNTIIIMTSNIGTRELKDFGAGIGFNTATVTKDYSHGVIQKALNQRFSPEFLNRVDDIVIFDPLDENAINKIIDIELKSFYKRVEELGFNLEITDKAKKFIAKKGYDSKYGARPLKRAIQTYVKDCLAEILLKEEAKSGDTISLTLNDGDDVLTATVIKTEQMAEKDATK